MALSGNNDFFIITSFFLNFDSCYDGTKKETQFFVVGSGSFSRWDLILSNSRSRSPSLNSMLRIRRSWPITIIFKFFNSTNKCSYSSFYTRDGDGKRKKGESSNNDGRKVMSEKTNDWKNEQWNEQTVEPTNNGMIERTGRENGRTRDKIRDRRASIWVFESHVF